MTTSIEEEINETLEECRKRYRHNWIFEFFNNFPLKMASAVSDSNFWKKRRGQVIYEEDYSPRSRGQTIGEFHKAYRQALTDSGVTIKQFREGYKKAGEDFNPENLKERIRTGNMTRDTTFFEKLLPAYTLLRKQGYSHRELTA